MSSIRLRYGLMADYAAPGAGGKPTIVGVMDQFYTLPLEGAPIELAMHTIHLRFEAPAHVGPKHLLELKIVDEDGKVVNIEVQDGKWQEGFQMPINFVTRGDGLGLINFIFFRVDHPIPLPQYGSYTWDIFVDGVRVGDIPFLVSELTPAVRKEVGLPPAVEPNG